MFSLFIKYKLFFFFVVEKSQRDKRCFTVFNFRSRIILFSSTSLPAADFDRSIGDSKENCNRSRSAYVLRAKRRRLISAVGPDVL